MDIFARDLNLDATRVTRSAFATAVLAAIWTIEDADDASVRKLWMEFAARIQPAT